MIEISQFFQGLIIGIIISIPLGPVGLITMKRTAEHGLRAGIASALAIVLIDTIAAVFILMNLPRLAPVFRGLSFWMQILGGTIVLLYGVRLIIRSTLPTIEEQLPWHKHFITAAFIALTNPSTYFSFGVISLLLTRFIDTPSLTRAEVATGFFIGAMIWWCSLAFIAFTQRSYLKARHLQKVVGGIIVILAIGTLIRIIL